MARVYTIEVRPVIWSLHSEDNFKQKVKDLTDVGLGEFMSCKFKDVGEYPEQKAARLQGLVDRQSSTITNLEREVARLRKTDKPKRKKAAK